MTNTYAIADLHGQLPPVPEDCDLLLIAGDICPDFGFGRHGAPQQSDWLDTTFREWLGTTDATVVATWGNHDYVGENGNLIPDLPWTILVDDDVVVNGIRIWGTPWVPNLPYWAFYGNQNTLEARADIIPVGLDVLMTHGPPFGYGDYIPGGSDKQANKYGNYHGMHVGDTSLVNAIKTTVPEVVVCGHIHEGRGNYRLSGVPVCNVAAVNENYDLYDKPFKRLRNFTVEKAARRAVLKYGDALERLSQ